MPELNQGRVLIQGKVAINRSSYSPSITYWMYCAHIMCLIVYSHYMIRTHTHIYIYMIYTLFGTTSTTTSPTTPTLVLHSIAISSHSKSAVFRTLPSSFSFPSFSGWSWDALKWMCLKMRGPWKWFSDSLFRSCSLDMFFNVALKDILLCHTHPMVSIMLLTKNCWVGRLLNGVSDRLMLERRKSTMMT